MLKARDGALCHASKDDLCIASKGNIKKILGALEGQLKRLNRVVIVVLLSGAREMIDLVDVRDMQHRISHVMSIEVHQKCYTSQASEVTYLRISRL